MKTKTMLLCIILGSWGTVAQHDHTGNGQQKSGQPAFKDVKPVAGYLEINPIH